MQLTKPTEADLRPTIDKWNAHSGGITEVAAALKIPRTTLSRRLEAAKRLGMQVRGGPPVAAAQRLCAQTVPRGGSLRSDHRRCDGPGEPG